MAFVLACGGADDTVQDRQQPEAPKPAAAAIEATGAAPGAPAKPDQPARAAAASKAAAAVKAVEAEAEPEKMAKPVLTAPTEKMKTEADRFGGILIWAGSGSVASIDTTCITSFNGGMTGNVYDALFGRDRSNVPQPQALGSWSIDADGKGYTFALRDGLTWHDDGSPVTAKDAVASTIRWSQSQHAIAKTVWDLAQPTLEQVDDKSWRMNLGTAFGQWAVYSGVNLQPYKVSGLIPAEECITDAQAIGNGPYRFVEWVPGDRIIYERYESYKPRSEPTANSSGAQTPYFDGQVMIEVPDISTRVAALKTGQIHYAGLISPDFIDDVNDDPDTIALTTGPGKPPYLVFNKTAVPMNNKKARQAVLIAADMEAWMTAAYGNAAAWSLDGAIFMSDGPWGTLKHTERYYAPPDLTTARRLWAEAIEEEGYDGKIVLLAANDYPGFGPAGLYTKQVMESIGADVDMPSVDWGSVIRWKIAGCEKPVEDGGWHAYHTRTGPFDPLTNEGFSTKWSCGWLNPTIQQLTKDWLQAPTIDEQWELIEEMQALVYEEVPYIQLGAILLTLAYRDEVEMHTTPFGVNARVSWFK